MTPPRTWSSRTLPWVATAAALAMAGCGREPEGDPPTVIPEPPADTAYVGVWADQPTLCGEMVWRISPTAIVSDSGVACLLSDLRPDAGGWTATSRCADAAPAGLSMRLSEAETTDTLVVVGPPSNAPVTLVRCAAPGEAPTELDPHDFLDMASAVDLWIASESEGMTVRRPVGNLMIEAVWLRDGEIVKIRERIVGGLKRTVRDFYYQPGKAQPFLIRDPEGLFAFVEGRLARRYSERGAVLPAETGNAMSPDALLRQSATLRDLAQSLPAGPDGDRATQTSKTGEPR